MNTALQVSQKLLRASTTQSKNSNNNKIKAYKHRTSTYLCNFSQHLMKCIFFWDSVSIYKCQIWNITCIHHLCNLRLCRISEHSISEVIHKGITFWWILHKLCYLRDSIRIFRKVAKKRNSPSTPNMWILTLYLGTLFRWDLGSCLSCHGGSFFTSLMRTFYSSSQGFHHFWLAL